MFAVKVLLGGMCHTLCPPEMGSTEGKLCRQMRGSQELSKWL